MQGSWLQSGCSKGTQFAEKLRVWTSTWVPPYSHSGNVKEMQRTKEPEDGEGGCEMLSSAHDMEIVLRSSCGSAICARPSQPKFQHVWGWVHEAPFPVTGFGNWWVMENILPGWYDHAPVMVQTMYLWAALLSVRCCFVLFWVFLRRLGTCRGDVVGVGGRKLYILYK